MGTLDEYSYGADSSSWICSLENEFDTITTEYRADSEQGQQQQESQSKTLLSNPFKNSSFLDSLELKNTRGNGSVDEESAGATSKNAIVRYTDLEKIDFSYNFMGLDGAPSGFERLNAGRYLNDAVTPDSNLEHSLNFALRKHNEPNMDGLSPSNNNNKFINFSMPSRVKTRSNTNEINIPKKTPAPTNYLKDFIERRRFTTYTEDANVFASDEISSVISYDGGKGAGVDSIVSKERSPWNGSDRLSRIATPLASSAATNYKNRSLQPSDSMEPANYMSSEMSVKQRYSNTSFRDSYSGYLSNNLQSNTAVATPLSASLRSGTPRSSRLPTSSYAIVSQMSRNVSDEQLDDEMSSLHELRSSMKNLKLENRRLQKNFTALIESDKSKSEMISSLEEQKLKLEDEVSKLKYDLQKSMSHLNELNSLMKIGKPLGGKRVKMERRKDNRSLMNEKMSGGSAGRGSSDGDRKESRGLGYYYQFEDKSNEDTSSQTTEIFSNIYKLFNDAKKRDNMISGVFISPNNLETPSLELTNEKADSHDEEDKLEVKVMDELSVEKAEDSKDVLNSIVKEEMKREPPSLNVEKSVDIWETFNDPASNRRVFQLCKISNKEQRKKKQSNNNVKTTNSWISKNFFADNVVSDDVFKKKSSESWQPFNHIVEEEVSDDTNQDKINNLNNDGVKTTKDVIEAKNNEQSDPLFGSFLETNDKIQFESKDIDMFESTQINDSTSSDTKGFQLESSDASYWIGDAFDFKEGNAKMTTTDFGDFQSTESSMGIAFVDTAAESPTSDADVAADAANVKQEKVEAG